MTTHRPRAARLVAFGVACCLSLSACDFVWRPADTVEVPFRPLSGYLIIPSLGTLVFRTEEEWEDALVPFLPDPAPLNFSDSLVIAVYHGMIYCTHSGGEVRQILKSGDRATVTFSPLVAKDVVCLADLPLQYFVQVAKADLPEEVEIEFEFPPVP